MGFSTFSTMFSTAKEDRPYTRRNPGGIFLESFGQKCRHSAFYKKESRSFFFAFYKPFPGGDLFFPIWNEPSQSFQHRVAAVFPCGKGRENCSFPHRKKQLLTGAPGANSPSLAALDRFLWDGAFGSTEKFPG